MSVRYGTLSDMGTYDDRTSGAQPWPAVVLPFDVLDGVLDAAEALAGFGHSEPGEAVETANDWNRARRRNGTRAQRAEFAFHLESGLPEAGGQVLESPPHTNHEGHGARLEGAMPTASQARRHLARLAASEHTDLDAYTTALRDHVPEFDALTATCRARAFDMLVLHVMSLRTQTTQMAANAAESVRIARGLLLALVVLLTTHSDLRPSVLTVPSCTPDAPDIPPPADTTALTTSTLTAAPPAPARPVPGARRAVLVTAG